MYLSSPDFADGGGIAAECAFGVPDPDEHLALGENMSPELEWGDVPAGTRSFALTLVDADVPSVGDDVNQEGRTVPVDLPRVEFAHWAVADIPGGVRSMARGEFGSGITARGKEGRRDGPVEGVNDYTGWFAGDPDMEGTYRGYDGPCPPWNDPRVHHYTLTLYALDVESLGLEAEFTTADVASAAAGHTLARAAITSTYSIYSGD